MDRKHKGAQSELIASAWLLAQGYEVFRNVSQHGDIDIVAMKDGVVSYYDVKTMKAGVTAPAAKPEQVKLGVKHLYVFEDGSCSEGVPPLLVETKACEFCGGTFKMQARHFGRARFCTKGCRHKSFRREIVRCERIATQ